MSGVVNKQSFLEIARDLHHFSKESIPQLKALQRQYPYSQILHALIAKLQKDAHDPEARISLNLAAMYATDRGLLKEIMKIPASPKPPEKKMIHHPRIEPLSLQEIMAETDPNDEMELIRNELLSNLKSLQRHRKIYLDYMYPSTNDRQGSAESSYPVAETLEMVKDPPPAPTVPKENRSMSSGSGEKKNSETQETAQENLKRKDQIKIINKFIKSEPSLTVKTQEKSDKIPQDDLASSSTEFGEDLVSENLASILINQGKNKKAIDIYKKLIWKFPQKKAYFAAQIEALKN